MAEEKLSDSYHRARRMFALLCGILIIWEYIGIEVGGKPTDPGQSGDSTTVIGPVIVDSNVAVDSVGDTIGRLVDISDSVRDSLGDDTTGILEHPPSAASSAEGTVGETGGASGTMPLVGIPVTFRNPEVIPTVIFILVLYFGFRFTIEWRQCPESIRDHRTTKVDAGVAYAIGFAAFVLFTVQRITEFRLAEFFGAEGMRFFAVGLAIAGVIGIIILNLIDDGRIKRLTGYIITLAISFAAYGMIAIVGDRGPSSIPDWVASAGGIVMGLLLTVTLDSQTPRIFKIVKLVRRTGDKADVEQAGNQK